MKGLEQMAMAGRKRKSGPREPNGQLQRPTQDENTATQLKVILDQPHRKGAKDPLDRRHESAFGRFCIRNKLRAEIEAAADSYAAKVRRIWAVKGVPTDLRISSNGSGKEPSDEAVARWVLDLDKIHASVVASCKDGGTGLAGVKAMILDGRDMPGAADAYLIQAAFWLAVAVGCLSAKDNPF